MLHFVYDCMRLGHFWLSSRWAIGSPYTCVGIECGLDSPTSNHGDMGGSEEQATYRPSLMMMMMMFLAALGRLRYISSSQSPPFLPLHLLNLTSTVFTLYSFLIFLSSSCFGHSLRAFHFSYSRNEKKKPIISLLRTDRFGLCFFDGSRRLQLTRTPANSSHDDLRLPLFIHPSRCAYE
jgi:hypothetical protein